MKQICKYNKGCDITQTVSGLETSIPEAMDYGTIQDTSVPAAYNQQKKISEVGQRIAEPFDVIEYDRSYTKLRKYINDSEYERKRVEEKK